MCSCCDVLRVLLIVRFGSMVGVFDRIDSDICYGGWLGVVVLVVWFVIGNDVVVSRMGRIVDEIVGVRNMKVVLWVV